MHKGKYYLAIDDYEYSIIIDSLNDLRNKLIAGGRYTDAVDELIVKFAYAPIKKFKIRMILCTRNKYQPKENCWRLMAAFLFREVFKMLISMVYSQSG